MIWNEKFDSMQCYALFIPYGRKIQLYFWKLYEIQRTIFRVYINYRYLISSIYLKHIALTVVITMKYIYVYTHNRNNQEVYVLEKTDNFKQYWKNFFTIILYKPFWCIHKKILWYPSTSLCSLNVIGLWEKKSNKRQAWFYLFLLFLSIQWFLTKHVWLKTFLLIHLWSSVSIYLT